MFPPFLNPLPYTNSRCAVCRHFRSRKPVPTWLDGNFSSCSSTVRHCAVWKLHSSAPNTKAGRFSSRKYLTDYRVSQSRSPWSQQSLSGEPQITYMYHNLKSALFSFTSRRVSSTSVSQNSEFILLTLWLIESNHKIILYFSILVFRL
jgi:hypothetical protein